MTESSGVREVKSAARTVELLELLGGLREPATLRELSERMSVPRSSLYALLQTLVHRGWVRTDPTGSLYSIGIRALLAGTAYIDADPRLALVRPHLDALSERLGETLHFARLDGPDVVYLATRESRHYLRPFSRVGRRLPAHSTSLGKALLAERSDEEVDALLPAELAALTETTVTDRAGLFAELAAIRGRGYAVDNGENVVGLTCLGVALRYDTPAMDALSCSIPTARCTPDLRERVLEALMETRGILEATGAAALSPFARP
ncbi:IclR family transcriptional regulator [Marinactinospora thermotolerans]|uniref:Glycerol operon regulatory protein n=1 Tax=Marinactinospora thermotolerans DSM 45154 TaxID=1122192 RepID=A0A1T4K069_9ACTN|nr:IclR family transcriptional regulator [Marinactinospora thermotolerans]SJZ35902.1 transcriptional regulator, IclR family [Marinactinospora thermotolerans DSM 45154]